MQLVVLGTQSQLEELLNNQGYSQGDLILINTIRELATCKDADALIDLLFDGSKERIDLLRNFSPATVIINSVVDTLQKLNVPFVRINAWPGFVASGIVEASTRDIKTKDFIQNVFSSLGKEVEWLPDIPGFVTARVIAMIINEACFALDENISTQEEIDAAMRLGTNYPHGPFEWCEKIGAKNVHDLLQELAKVNPRYKPSTLLTKMATI